MLAAKQLSSTCLYAKSIVKRLPCHASCCPLPKGAIGIQRTKDLHNDGNLAVILGIWTSVWGDPNVVIRFVAKSFNIYFRTSDLRFCWFMGWIPHKTEVLLDQNLFTTQHLENPTWSTFLFLCLTPPACKKLLKIVS
jgi:hypothetical protein